MTNPAQPSSPKMPTEGRHPSTLALTKYFTSDHLPPHLRPTSGLLHDFAALMVSSLPDSPELTAGLRKLLEAKDCFVRATVDAHRETQGDVTV